MAGISWESKVGIPQIHLGSAGHMGRVQGRRIDRAMPMSTAIVGHCRDGGRSGVDAPR